MKSLRPKDRYEPPDGGACISEAGFRGQTSSNDTHHSTTVPPARLYCKAKSELAKLFYLRHTLMDNRPGLIVETHTTAGGGPAARRSTRHSMYGVIASD